MVYLEKGQLPDLLNLSKTWLKKPSKGVFGHLLQGRLNQKSILVESVRPLGNYRDHRDARPQHWRRMWESSDSIDDKMSIPSRGRSSAKGGEDYREWLETIERRKLASERQMQALLQETERLREENAMLRIQASSTGPPRSQRSRGQVANSRPEPTPNSLRGKLELYLSLVKETT